MQDTENQNLNHLTNLSSDCSDKDANMRDIQLNPW